MCHRASRCAYAETAFSSLFDPSPTGWLVGSLQGRLEYLKTPSGSALAMEPVFGTRPGLLQVKVRMCGLTTFSNVLQSKSMFQLAKQPGALLCL